MDTTKPLAFLVWHVLDTDMLERQLLVCPWCVERFFFFKKKKNCGHGLNMVTQSSLSLSLCHSIDCLSVSPPRWVFRLVAIQACFQFKILGKKKMLLLCEAYVKNSCLWRWRMEFWERLIEYRLRNRILVLDNQFSN